MGGGVCFPTETTVFSGHWPKGFLGMFIDVGLHLSALNYQYPPFFYISSYLGIHKCTATLLFRNKSPHYVGVIGLINTIHT